MIYHTVELEQLIWWNGPSQLPFVLSKIDQAVEQGEPVTILGSLLWEAHYPVTENFVLFLEEIKKRQLPVFLFFNFMLNNKDSELVKKVVDMGIVIIYIDFFFWRVYQEIIVKQTNKTNSQWNANADKFLFLTGKPNKINRVGLLWKFYKKDLLKHAIWSLYVQDKDREATLKTLANQGVALDVANQFIDEYQWIPDNADIIFWPDGGSHYGGIPYDDTLYANVKFRVISETSFQSGNRAELKKPWLTEKTWLTIVNCCPFIIAGEQRSLDYLESLGFRTFKKYLELTDYNNLQGQDTRINAIVTNAASWLTNSELVGEIRHDIEHNYNHFIQLGKAMETDLLQQIQDNGLQAQVKDIIPTVDTKTKGN
jgi:hypothetical protein